MTAAFSHDVVLEYDDISSKSRMSAATVQILEALFARESTHRFEHRFLRATRNRKRNTARSTTHVLDAGRIDSPLCFSIAKFRKDRKFWITPNGWRTATFGNNLLFIAETKVSHTTGSNTREEMTYRFTLMRDNETPKQGQWNINLQNAFASLFQMDAALEQETNWNKVSKEVLLAVHCDLIQSSLLEFWEELKSRLSSADLELALQYECGGAPTKRAKPARTLSSSSQSTVTTTYTVPQIELKHQLLTLTQLLEVFSAVSGRLVQSWEMADMLYLLEAGQGVQIELVLYFMELCDEITKLVYSHAQHQPLLEVLVMLLGKPTIAVNSMAWLEYCAVQEPYTLRFRAVLLIFDRMQQMAADVTTQQSDAEFRKQIFRLPDSSTCRKRIREMFGNM